MFCYLMDLLLGFNGFNVYNYSFISALCIQPLSKPSVKNKWKISPKSKKTVGEKRCQMTGSKH